ncbi:hypothetical protein niasHS_002061 [Heterodera schachtii]|uniref:Sodium/potassium-transporting ATPase subunit beta-1-interacting protein n=1 Tax=Heterodera schachtii TaxID=97005 RepID=A0ABD2K5R2_HETSC
MARKLHFCALIWLVLWLALSTVRQVFDVIGKLWALVLIDMVQLIAIMSGLIALCQPSLTPCRNRLLLTVLALISALSVGHNVAVLLWFCTDLLVADHRQSDLLSFGLPFGHSFFLRHTPLCESHFNLSDSVEQSEQQQTTEHCPIQYSHLEGGQAVLHTLMALGTLLLVVSILLWNNDNDDGDRNRGYGSTRVAERSVKKYGFAEDYVTTAGAGDTVTATAKELGSVYMEPSCCFEDALSATGSVQLVASGKVLAPPAMAPVLGGVVRRSYPRAGRRPTAGAAGGPDGDCPQRSKRSNLKKTAHNRSTPASPSPVVPSSVGAVHERYSSLSTAGAIDAVQPYFHNNNTASSSSTASAYGSNTSNSNKTMASNGSGAINNYHNRNQQAPLQYAYGSRRRPSPSFYTPLAGLAAVGGAPAAPRSPCSFGGGAGDRSGIVMQQLPQHRLPYTNNNYRRGGSMRTFCAVAPGAECCEPGDASAGVAGDYAVQRRQRVSFSPPACSVLSNCSPSSISQHHQNALALRRGTDGRRSAGPAVTAGDPSVNRNSRQQQMASLINFGPIVQNNSQHHHITSLISFDPKSNTLIRVREHRRPSSSSSSLEEASGGDRYSVTQPATGQLAAATGDCSESVPSSPAPELSPSSCPPAAGRFELLQQPVSAAGRDHMKGQSHHAPPLVNNGINSNSAPQTRIANVPSSSASGRGQQKLYYYDYGGLDNSSNSYGGNGQIGPNNNNNQNNKNSLQRDSYANDPSSAIRLSSHSDDNGTSATDAVAATGGDCGDRSQTATAATTAFRPRVGTTNETMLGMFV